MGVMEKIDAWWIIASKKRRIDRNAGNMCMLMGLIFPSFVIFLRGPSPISPVADMPIYLQVWMCAFIFFGCCLKLHGVLAHSRFYFPHLSLKKCYMYGFIGAPMAVSGLAVYSIFLLMATPDFWAAITAVLTPFLALGVGIQAFFYWLEFRRIEHNEEDITDNIADILKEKEGD